MVINTVLLTKKIPWDDITSCIVTAALKLGSPRPEEKNVRKKKLGLQHFFFLTSVSD